MSLCYFHSTNQFRANDWQLRHSLLSASKPRKFKWPFACPHSAIWRICLKRPVYQLENKVGFITKFYSECVRSLACKRHVNSQRLRFFCLGIRKLLSYCLIKSKLSTRDKLLIHKTILKAICAYEMQLHFQHKNSRTFPIENLAHDIGRNLVRAEYGYPKGSPNTSS
jgi:hypothetical protein